MLDHPLLQSFVSPAICRQLLDAGLNIKAPFCWKQERGGKTSLYSLSFDDDCYYTAAYNLQVQMNAITLVPAFQLMDMEKLLPDHLLSKTNNVYELNCSSLFCFDVERGTRLPDVYAAVVLKGIQEYKIDAGKAIKQLSLTN